MKTIFAVLLGLIVVAATAVPAEAALFRGLRGRSNVVAVNVGGANVAVRNRGFLGRNTRVFVNANRGFNNRGFNNRGFNNHGFSNRGFNNRGFNRANVQVNVNGHGFNSFNNHARANVFGTRTFVDNGGNIFEVDQFGNTRFRGSAFRGFSHNGAFVNAGFRNNGFNSFNSFSTFNSGNCLGNACFSGGGQVRSFGGFGGCR